MLTEHEVDLIHLAATDLETGQFLLTKRSRERVEMLKELSETLATDEKDRTERQKEIFEDYKLCTDYNYWKSKQNEN